MLLVFDTILTCSLKLFQFSDFVNMQRFFASEIIRATLFQTLGKELPYCCEVRIEEFREPRPNEKKQIIKISANICVERDSQKGIVVGKGGQKIRDVGIKARKELENFLLGKVSPSFRFLIF